MYEALCSLQSITIIMNNFGALLRPHANKMNIVFIYTFKFIIKMLFAINKK